MIQDAFCIPLGADVKQKKAQGHLQPLKRPPSSAETEDGRSARSYQLLSVHHNTARVGVASERGTDASVAYRWATISSGHHLNVNNTRRRANKLRRHGKASHAEAIAAIARNCPISITNSIGSLAGSSISKTISTRPGFPLYAAYRGIEKRGALRICAALVPWCGVRSE